MRFRLTWYNTMYEDKFAHTEGQHRHEYLGSANDILTLWYILVKVLKFPHVEVYNLQGMKQNPEKGLYSGMVDYGL